MPAAVLLIAGQALAADPATSEARVTRVIRDVKLLPSESAARAAAVDDKVQEDTAVRTGEDSRSELTFVDLTITRLGANTTFTFNKAGRNVQLNEGTVLLYLPKDSDGVKMSTSAVSAAITGTTVVLRSTKTGRSQLSVLEGTARASLIKYPRETTDVRGGQMIDVKRGATKMPRPINIDLRKAMESPLITDFDPLPSQSLILAGMNNPPIKTSQPSGPAPIPPLPPAPSPQCWCCINGTVIQITETECQDRGGQCYGSRDEAIRNCSGVGPTRPPPPWCWCCINGKVVKTTQAGCRDRDGQCYGSREEALRNCSGGSSPSPRQGWCCINGKVVQATEAECQARDGQYYGSREEAARKCRKIDQTCWCCINGKVVQTTEADCQERDGQCYGSREEALKKCSGAGPTSPKGWCCIDGKVVQATEAECQERGGQYYGSRKEALKKCSGGVPNPSPHPTPHGKRTPHGNPKGTPPPGGGGYVPGNTGIAGGQNSPGRPKKPIKYPKGKPTPTPKPGQQY